MYFLTGPKTKKLSLSQPAYGVYISQLVRYGKICTSKVDFVDSLCRLSSRLNQQGFK